MKNNFVRFYFQNYLLLVLIGYKNINDDIRLAAKKEEYLEENDIIENSQSKGKYGRQNHPAAQ